eukprot:845882-Rhodomonas_salina.1
MPRTASDCGVTVKTHKARGRANTDPNPTQSTDLDGAAERGRSGIEGRGWVDPGGAGEESERWRSGDLPRGWRDVEQTRAVQSRLARLQRGLCRLAARLTVQRVRFGGCDRDVSEGFVWSEVVSCWSEARTGALVELGVRGWFRLPGGSGWTRAVR